MIDNLVLVQVVSSISECVWLINILYNVYLPTLNGYPPSLIEDVFLTEIDTMILPSNFFPKFYVKKITPIFISPDIYN